MKRTPIIVPGQVFLHPLNEYIVVTKANRGDISFKGAGITGMHEAELFLQRFGPVDPADLSAEEQRALAEFTNKPLCTGWVVQDGDFDEEE
jgi:hypothetical protein